MEIIVNTKLADILTPNYQISGNLEVRGNPAVFLNDQTIDVFIVREATVMPLVSGTQVGEMKIPKMYVPKDHIHVVLLDMSLQEASLLPTKIEIVCFTNTYVIRGAFSTGPETSPVDIFNASPGPFFPAVSTEVFALRPLTAEIGGQAPLLYVRGDKVETFYSPGG